jgi:uncharacterized protein YfaS (alpha-2-macroglobulin family)/tetratricopeptide (TPR) repeat protein
MKNLLVPAKVMILAGMLAASCMSPPSAPLLENKDAAADFTRADQAFEKGTFQEAFDAYQSAFKGTNDPAVKHKSFFRMCESLTHLFRYGEAAQLLIDTPLPEAMPDKARVLLLKTGLLSTFVRQYSYLLNRNENEETSGTKNAFHLTREQVEAEIENSYKALSGMESTLTALSLKDQGYYFFVDKVDFNEFPTAFDFFVSQWAESILSGQTLSAADIGIILAGESLRTESQAKTIKAADLMEHAARVMANVSPESAEYWRVKRLAILLDVGWNVADADKANKLRDQAIAAFNDFMEKLTRPGPRALAGYKAATLLNQYGKYVQAREICERIAKDFPGAPSVPNARALRQQIVNPYLYLNAATMTPTDQKKLTLVTRNLKQVYFRAYRLKGQVLAQAERTPSDLYDLAYGNVMDDGMGKQILGGEPDLSWTADTGDAGKHEYLTVAVTPPHLSEGIYLVVACHEAYFVPGYTLWCSSLVNVTRLMLVGTPGAGLKSRAAYYSLLAGTGGNEVKDSVARYYAFDITTGKPVPGARIFAGWTRNYQSWQRSDLATATAGATLDLPLSVLPDAYNQFNLAPLAKKGDSYSYLEYLQSSYTSQPDALEFFVTTDRPIYRPGDKLQAKVSGVRRTSDGFRALNRDFTVTVEAHDPNGNNMVTKDLKLNDFGSADIEFEIPRGKLLGAYSLSVSSRRGILAGSSSASFRVEEYKRPEFEVVFDEIASPVRFGRPVELTGSVKYYFGGAAANADVSFAVTHSMYVPWYFRSWFWGGYQAPARETASGQIKTDDKGKFRIVFTPKPEDIELPAWLRNGLAPEITQYDVKVDARDSGGRTITGTTSCKVGKRSFYFTAQTDKGFYFEKDKAVLNAGKLSVNDKPLAGDAAYEVHLLADPKLQTLEELGYGGATGSHLTPSLPGPDFQLKDAANLTLAAQGTLRFGSEGQSQLTLLALAPGAYRLTLKGKDDDGGDVVFHKIFLVVNNAGKDIPLNLATVTLFDKDDYQVGETARLVIGSRFTAGTYVMELWSGQYFVRSIVLDNAKPIQAVDVPVTADMKGGFSVRWFGVKGLDLFYGQDAAAVSWAEKTLDLALDPFKGTLLPGEKAAWGVRLKNAAGKSEQGEVLVLMYDRSLEYYAQSSSRGFADLYLPNRAPDTASTSDFQPRTYTFPVRSGALYDQLYNATRLEEGITPGFRTDRTAIYYRTRANKGKDNDMMFDMVAPAPMVAEQEKMADKKEVSTSLSADDGRTTTNKAPAPMPAVQARQAFADTAFFLPHVTTNKDGTARFEFTAPEQLTGWKIKAFAYTKEAAWGELSQEAVTRKDLMVRLDLPRFFREKDQGTVTAVIHNESEGPLTGRLWIDIVDSGNISVLAALKLVEPSKPFTLKAHSQASFDWAVSVPAGIGSYTVRAVVKTEPAGKEGPLSDAEERALPILPSRQRLIESAFTIIKGNATATISIPAALDPTRLNESVTLSIDPQLTLNLMNTLPFLIDYPYSCVEQTLNKYVPLAIINEIYGKYPEVRKAVAKIPKRDTVTPPWDKEDPLRQLQIDETPWGWEAAGRPTIYPVIDMLNPAIVAAQKESVFATLKASQLSTGAFPWWPGGRADLYMTLYALDSLAEAKRYGVAVDVDMINRALRYVGSVIPEHFKPEPDQLALVAYASYVITSFPAAEFSEAAPSLALAKSWFAFIYEHRFALTPFGKAYLAYISYRLNEKAKGDEVLAMALDGSREDAVAGVYWTPEAYSWVWYSDTVEKHAFFLKTLLDWKPDDKRIDGMARWLLWNRKGNVWKSTKASSAALYVLLNYLSKGGALFSDERFTVDWGKTREKLQVKGDEWQAKPLRLQRPEGDIAPPALSATVTKEGQGTSIASLTWIYSTDQLPQASGPGLLELKRQFFLRVKDGATFRLREIKSGDEVAVGDQIEVKISFTTKSQFEYMHLKDPKAAGFEAETLLSGWKYDPLWYYEEPRDSSTNFFLDWIPHGEYVLRYTLRPTKPGQYRIGAATLQSMYSPELNAHSDGFLVKVRK